MGWNVSEGNFVIGSIDARTSKTMLGCDDGNLISGDGCDSTCRIEWGWNCSGGNFTSRDSCAPVCGDGLVVAGREVCDDGNLLNGDGCNGTCIVELGWSCANINSVMYKTGSLNAYLRGNSSCLIKCGDGLHITGTFFSEGNFIIGSRTDPISGAIQFGCDDNNTVSGDGCSSTCLVETGYNCSGGTPSQYDACNSICGDGRRVGFELCDDSNLIAGDGCSPNCTVEWGWTCFGGSNSILDLCYDATHTYCSNWALRRPSYSNTFYALEALKGTPLLSARKLPLRSHDGSYTPDPGYMSLTNGSLTYYQSGGFVATFPSSLLHASTLPIPNHFSSYITFDLYQKDGIGYGEGVSMSWTDCAFSTGIWGT